MTVARVTQEVVESVSNVTANARLSQLAVEAVSTNALKAYVTQLAVEMVSESVPDDPDDAAGPSMIIIAT